MLSSDSVSRGAYRSNAITETGMINRIGAIFAIFLAVAALAYGWTISGAIGTGAAWVALLGGLALVIFMCVSPESSPILAPLYAVAEGVVIGWISAHYEKQFGGIVLQAAATTIGISLAMYALYFLRILQATPGFVKFVLAATLGIAITYLLDILLSVFTGHHVPFLHETGKIGIGISLFVTLIAALNLIIDFDNIEQAVKRGAPTYMGWFCAVGLLVTVVWIYLEVLRLLAKLKSDD